MEPMLRRRIPRALAVTAVALLVFGSGAGFAASAGSHGLPDRFGVAEPHADDRWRYTIDATWVSPDETEETTWEMDHRWLDATPWMDGEGRQHAVRPLLEESHWPSGRVSQVAHLMSMVDGTVLGTETEGMGLGGFVSWALSPLFVREMGEREELYHVTSYGGGPQPFCGYRSPLQGAEVDLSRTIRVRGACVPEIEEEAGFSFGDEYTAQAVETLDGIDTVRFGRAFEHGQVRLWFARHVPYPVQVHVEMDLDLGGLQGQRGSAEAFGTAHAEVRMRMTAFDAGTEPLVVPVALPPDRVVPPVETAPAHVYGPDDSGVDHPYRLSEAWHGAMDDLLYSDLRDFMADHPDARVRTAEGWSQQADRSLDHWWRFEVDDGGDLLVVQAVRHEWNDTPEGRLAALTEPAEEYDSGPWTLTHEGGAFPEALPTVQSLLARYAAMYPDRPVPNTWSVDLDCFLDCSTAQDVGVGRVDHREGSSGNLTDRRTVIDMDRHMLHAASDGSILQSVETTSSERRDAAVLLTPTPSGSVPDAPPGQEPLRAQATAWTLPSPPTRVGVAGAAVLVGLLYWLWPLLKSGGAVGLFSRLRREELLEHPMRASIVDAVRSQPGIHHSALVRLFGRGKGVVEHHLRKLRDAGLVVVRKSAGRTCYFMRGAADAATMDAVPHLSPAAARVLEWVAANPGRSASEAARGVGVTDGTMSHHVRRLREAGLLRAEPGALYASHVGGRAVRMALADCGAMG